MHFNYTIQIADKQISHQSPVFIIAEAGVNHNGNMETAFKLIDAAYYAKVDAVKFQTFKTESLILKGVEKAPYQNATTGKTQSQYEMLKELELTYENYVALNNYCKEKGIIFLSTPFEIDSLNLLDKLDVPAIKIAATDLTNIQYLKRVARVGKPIILSAGMCYLEEIKRAMDAIYPINKDVVLLQCTANYPIDDDEVNLNVIDTLKKEFDIIVGYSDHSKGVGAAPYAVTKGAKVIEKHFTLSKHASGPDHQASVLPEELALMVSSIRQAEKYMGSGIKMPTVTEQFTRKSLQKYFVAAKSIKCGERFSDDNIVAKRTNGEGISALYYESLIKKRAKRDFMKNDIIEV